MTQKLLYPAGYMVKIETWENDADNYNTAEVSGLTEQQTKIIVAVCKLFKAQTYGNDPNYIGNMYEPSGSEIEDAGAKLLEVLQSLGLESDEVGECKDQESSDDWDTGCGIFYKHIGQEFYDLNMCGGEFFTRVVSKVTVMFFDTDVFADDVSDVFGV